jgi:alanyl-tRNA synthetase
VYNNIPPQLVSFHGFGYGTLAVLANDPNIHTDAHQYEEQQEQQQQQQAQGQQREEEEMEQSQQDERRGKQPMKANAKVGAP